MEPRHHALESKTSHSARKPKTSAQGSYEKRKVPWELSEIQQSTLNFRRLGWRPKYISVRSQKTGRVWLESGTSINENISSLMFCSCKNRMLKIREFMGRTDWGKSFRTICNQRLRRQSQTSHKYRVKVAPANVPRPESVLGSFTPGPYGSLD